MFLLITLNKRSSGQKVNSAADVCFSLDAAVAHAQSSALQHPFLEHAQSRRTHQPGPETRGAHTLSGESLYAPDINMQQILWKELEKSVTSLV